MYCLNCGKEIPDVSKFCVYCGTPTAAEANKTEVQADEILNGGETAGETAETASGANAAISQIPYPQPIESSGASAVPQTVSMTVPLSNNVLAKPEKREPEKKYTIKHIVMCLVSTAVCAIAAGIFAGLYFSVV